MINKRALSLYIPMVFLLMLISAPVLTFVPEIYSFIITGTTVPVFSPRRISLLADTVFYALFTGLLSAIIGAAGAVNILSLNRKIRKIIIYPLFAISIAMFFVPPYIHALSWSALFNISAKLFSGFKPSGTIASSWVMAMSLLPLSLGFSLIGFSGMDKAFIDSARMRQRDDKIFFSAILPRALPSILCSVLAVFLLTLHDYSVPSLFYNNIYSLDIYAEYSFSNKPAIPFLMSVPLIVLSIFITIFIYSTFRPGQSSIKIGSNDISPLELPSVISVIQTAALLVISLQCLVPVISLIYQVKTPYNLLRSLRLSSREIFYSFGISTLCALICTTVAYNSLLFSNKIKALLFIPLLTIPAPLTGIGLIILFGSTPIYSTFIMPVLASFTRFLPIALVMLAVWSSSLDKNLIDAGEVLKPTILKGFLKVRLVLMLPGIAASFAAVFILSAGELGATLLVVPPGYSTLTIKIYNYMHYGSSDLIAGLCLFMLFTAMICAFVVYTAFWKNHRKGDRNA